MLSFFVCVRSSCGWQPNEMHSQVQEPILTNQKRKNILPHSRKLRILSPQSHASKTEHYRPQ
ncbi:hypothetical protein [Rubritalea tangerina]|uniref:hypothetical protein n=1 Tax=Rubritalea tangerina TaxID=430798 RepID=UPI0036141466